MWVFWRHPKSYLRYEERKDKVKFISARSESPEFTFCFAITCLYQIKLAIVTKICKASYGNAVPGITGNPQFPIPGWKRLCPLSEWWLLKTGVMKKWGSICLPCTVVVAGGGVRAQGSGFFLLNTDTCCSCEWIPTFQLVFFNAYFLCIFVNWETSKLFYPGKTREIGNSNCFKLGLNEVQMLSCAC